MMNLSEVMTTAIRPALALLPPKMDSTEAHIMLLSIGQQESAFAARRQITSNGPGPAAGFWQFEAGGGVKGVMQHPASKDLTRTLCAARKVSFDTKAIWTALQTDDVLAAGFARLLLWTDPKPLPKADEVQPAWGYYYRNWRPGKPHPEKWPDNHARSCAFCLRA